VSSDYFWDATEHIPANSAVIDRRYRASPNKKLARRIASGVQSAA
jgi:hypothetical protein